MNLWDEIDRTDFDGDMAEAVEAIGIEAVVKLMELFGGEAIYFPKLQRVIRACRDRKIYQEFDGFNLRALAVTYDLSTRQIRAIIDEQRRKNPKSKVKELDLFGDCSDGYGSNLK